MKERATEIHIARDSKSESTREKVSKRKEERDERGTERDGGEGEKGERERERESKQSVALVDEGYWLVGGPVKL